MAARVPWFHGEPPGRSNRSSTTAGAEGEQDLVDELFVLIAAAVSADQLHPRPGSATGSSGFIRSDPSCQELSTETWHHTVRPFSPSSAYIVWLSVRRASVGVETPAIARTRCRSGANVSNELSNYGSAKRQPPLDDPGSFGAPGTGFDDHLACLTPKQSETFAGFSRMPCRRLL